MEDNELKFKDLDNKKKIEHIWEYYKIPIIGAILIIIVIISFVLKEPEPNLYCGIGIYGPHVSMDNLNILTSTINSKAQVPEGESVEITDFYLTEDDKLQDVDMVNKFNTYIMTLQLHLLMSNADRFTEFIQAEYIVPVTEYLSEEDVAMLDAENLIYYAKGPSDSEEQPYGIRIDNAKLFKDNNILQDEEIYAGFVPIMENSEKTLNVINSIIK